MHAKKKPLPTMKVGRIGAGCGGAVTAIMPALPGFAGAREATSIDSGMFLDDEWLTPVYPLSSHLALAGRYCGGSWLVRKRRSGTCVSRDLASFGGFGCNQDALSSRWAWSSGVTMGVDRNSEGGHPALMCQSAERLATPQIPPSCGEGR
jgi:hypothetical protein